MMEISIYKHRLTGNFTQISNRIIDDTRLSCEAYRLLSWVLHCHPDKRHSFDEWQEVLHVGIRKLKKVLAELVELGYVKQIQKRNEYGQFMRTEYQFFDSSSQEDFTVCPKPSDGLCKDTYYNTSNKSNMSVLSCPETKSSDFSQTESSENSESNENLTDCITSSINEIIAEEQELEEKISLILDMPSFITSLTDIIQSALQHLKHPEAKAKYIKSIIINKINEFKVKKQTQGNAPTACYYEKNKNNKICENVIRYLNALVGSAYKPTSRANRELIDGLVSEGFTETEIITVIDKKYAEWHGTEWEKFLRPRTLFGQKFETYFNSKTFKPQNVGYNRSYRLNYSDGLDDDDDGYKMFGHFRA